MDDNTFKYLKEEKKNQLNKELQLFRDSLNH